MPLVLDKGERSITVRSAYEHLHELTFVQFPGGPDVDNWVTDAVAREMPIRIAKHARQY